MAQEREQWRGPEMKAHWDATRTYPSGEEGAAISAWAADQCRKALGPEISATGGKLYGALVIDAK